MVGRIVLKHSGKSWPIIILSPLLGLLVLTIQLTVFGLLRVPWNVYTITVPWILVCIYQYRWFLSAFFDLISRFSKLFRYFRKLTILQQILVLVIVYVLVVIILNIVASPMHAWDAIAMWAYKAKVYLNNSNIGISDFVGDTKKHPDYPPLIPTLYALFGIYFGKFSTNFIKTVDIIFLTSALGLFLYYTSRNLGKSIGLISTLTLLLLPAFYPFITSGQYIGTADFALAMSFLIAGLCLVLYLSEKEKNSIFIVLGFLFSIVAALIKNEGMFWLISYSIIATMLVRQNYKVVINKNKLLTVLSILALSLLVGWVVYSKLLGAESDLFKGIIHTANPALMMNKLIATLKSIISMSRSNLGVSSVLILLLLIVSISLFSFRNKKFITLLLLVLSQLAIYMFVYSITPYDPVAHVNTSFDRLVIHIAPLAILMLFMGMKTIQDGWSED